MPASLFLFHLYNQHVDSHLHFAGEEIAAPSGGLTWAASQCGSTFLRPDPGWAGASIAILAIRILLAFGLGY